MTLYIYKRIAKKKYRISVKISNMFSF